MKDTPSDSVSGGINGVSVGAIESAYRGRVSGSLGHSRRALGSRPVSPVSAPERSPLSIPCVCGLGRAMGRFGEVPESILENLLKTYHDSVLYVISRNIVGGEVCSTPVQSRATKKPFLESK